MKSNRKEIQYSFLKLMIYLFLLFPCLTFSLLWKYRPQLDRNMCHSQLLFVYSRCGASGQQHKQDLRRIYKRKYKFSNSPLFTTMHCIQPDYIALRIARVHLATNNAWMSHHPAVLDNFKLEIKKIRACRTWNFFKIIRP